MKRHKYKAYRTVCSQGHNHPSKREAKRCEDLHLLQRGGKISGLTYEPFYPFIINEKELKHDNGRRFGYKPDFGFTEDEKPVVEDVKSTATMTEAFVIRALLFRHLYPEIELRIIT